MTTESEGIMTAHQNSLASIESQVNGATQGLVESQPQANGCLRLEKNDGVGADACRTIAGTVKAAI
jgi:hypothetical protein